MSKGKICKLIIDSGSYDNLVSYDMVDKLGLKKFAHPSPCHATWVSHDQDMVVNEEAYVEISIGPYQDMVLCEVIPMTCGHIILGRPWQHMRRTLHDGFTDSYFVHKEGKKFNLTPLPCGNKKDDVVIFFGETLQLCMYGNKEEDTGWVNHEKLQQSEVNNSPKEQKSWDLDSIKVGDIDCPMVEQRHVVQPLNLQRKTNQKNDIGRQGELQEQGPRQGCQYILFDTNISDKMHAGCRRRITRGEWLWQDNKWPSRRIHGRRSQPFISWDKRFFFVGEYGAGAPQRQTEDMKTSRRKDGFQGVNYDILTPIMACNVDKFNVRVKSPNGPERTLGPNYACNWDIQCNRLARV